MNRIKSAMKTLVNRCGFDVCRVSNKPLLTLCGLNTRPVQTIIDVGSNSGQFAKYISAYFPAADMYCFEPLPEPFQKLKEWAGRREQRISLFNMALGEEIGTVEMNCHTQHTPSSSILSTTEQAGQSYPVTREQSKIHARMDTLDNVLRDVIPDMKGEILLKLDVQGYEDRVLRGGEKVLSKAAICIVEASIENLYATQANFIDLANLLYKAGYFYSGNLDQSCASDGRIVFLDAVFKKP